MIIAPPIIYIFRFASANSYLAIIESYSSKSNSFLSFCSKFGCSLNILTEYSDCNSDLTSFLRLSKVIRDREIFSVSIWKCRDTKEPQGLLIASFCLLFISPYKIVYFTASKVYYGRFFLLECQIFPSIERLEWVTTFRRQHGFCCHIDLPLMAV